MASLEEVGVHLTAKDDQSSRVRHAREELDRYNRSGRDSEGATRAAGRGAGELTASLGGLHSGLTRVSASLGDFAVRQVQRATVGLVGMTTAAVGFGLRSASMFEQYDVSFGTMLESTERGKALMDDLAAFNLKTPFDLPGLANATQQMLLYGYAAEGALSTVKTVSDVAASSGPRMQESLGRMTLALGQIKAKGVLQGEEIRQLTEAGFPAYQLLTEISGKTVAELRKDMERGLDPALAEQFLAAVESGQAQTFQRFRGGAERQSKTLLGIWSNFKDNLNRKLADETSPLGAKLATGMPEFEASLNRLISVALPPVIDMLGDAVDAAPGFLTEATPVLRDLVGVTRDFVPVLGDLTQIAGELLPIVGDVLGVFRGLLTTEYGHEAAAVMLTTLLGYRALTGVVGAVTAMAGALDMLTGAQARNAAAGGVGGAAATAGRGGRAARVGVGALGVVGAVGTATQIVGGADSGLGWNSLGTVGSGALTGAALGSVLPGPGTAVGAALGAGVAGVGVLGAEVLRRNSSDAGRIPASAVRGASSSSTQMTVAPGAISVDARNQAPAETSDALLDALRRWQEEQDRRGGQGRP